MIHRIRGRNLKATVLIDTYNHERFIERAIRSVLEQDMSVEDFEILVVDDGSTDGTPAIIHGFEPRVRLIRKLNGGQASAFNMGVKEARGEIVAFLDGDDWWAPGKLSRVVEVMTEDPSLGIIGHGINIVQLDGSCHSETLRDGFCFQANTVQGAQLLRVRGSLLGTSRMTIRAELLHRIGPVPDELVIQADEYLYTLAALMERIRILPECLAFYRLHDANGFQVSGFDPKRLRGKQKALSILSKELSTKFCALAVPSSVADAIVERIRADADQLRLMLDGGWPWETLRTERTIYQIMYPQAPAFHRAFKVLSLLSALVIPPKSYYGLQRKLSTNKYYLKARHRWLPNPEMNHLSRRIVA